MIIKMIIIHFISIQRMVMVLQQNRKLFKMMKMKVGFQVDAMIKSAHF